MTNECLVDKQAQLKLNPLLDRQPVQFSQSGRHMVAWSEVHDDSSGGVQYPLSRRQCRRWDYVAKGRFPLIPGATRCHILQLKSAKFCRFCKICKIIIVQKLVAVSHAACAHVGRPKKLEMLGYCTPNLAGVADVCGIKILKS